MKPLALAFIAAVALLGVPSNAQAVFVATLIDDFSDPASPVHVSSAGAPSPESTRASGGTSGSIVALSSGTDIALDRGLSESAALVSAVAGGSSLSMTLPFPGDIAAIDWDVDGYDFSTSVVIGLLGLTNNLALPALLGISLYQDGVMTDSVVVAIDPVSTTDVFLTAAAIPTDFIGLEFTNLSAFTIFASVDQVIASPEPTTMALIGLGVLGGAIGYRRRSKEEDVPQTAA